MNKNKIPKNSEQVRVNPTRYNHKTTQRGQDDDEKKFDTENASSDSEESGKNKEVFLKRGGSTDFENSRENNLENSRADQQKGKKLQ